MRLVVFGWGNDARGDDGLGPLLLERVARAAWPDVTTVEDFQLQIEHALSARRLRSSSTGGMTPGRFREAVRSNALSPAVPRRDWIRFSTTPLQSH